MFPLVVNGRHVDAAGFGDRFAAASDDGRVCDLGVVELPVSDRSRFAAADAAEHSGTVAAVAVFLGE